MNLILIRQINFGYEFYKKKCWVQSDTVIYSSNIIVEIMWTFSTLLLDRICYIFIFTFFNYNLLLVRFYNKFFNKTGYPCKIVPHNINWITFYNWIAFI